MKRKGIMITTLLAAILVVSVYSLSSGGLTGRAVDSPAKEAFAQCLTDNNVKMYGAYWCGHCADQKALFGKAFNKIDYIECDPNGKDSQRELCLTKGIKGYPTWEINGQLNSGVKSLEELSALTQCEISEQ